MNKYERYKQLTEDLRNLAVKYQMTIFTATQVPREFSGRVESPSNVGVSSTVLIDHSSLVRDPLKSSSRFSQNNKNILPS